MHADFAGKLDSFLACSPKIVSTICAWPFSRLSQPHGEFCKTCRWPMSKCTTRYGGGLDLCVYRAHRVICGRCGTAYMYQAVSCLWMFQDGCGGVLEQSYVCGDGKE